MGGAWNGAVHSQPRMLPASAAPAIPGFKVGKAQFHVNVERSLPRDCEKLETERLTAQRRQERYA
jgi:hypothetical protein